VSTAVLLPLAVFVALGVPIVVLVWRIFVVGGELRRDAQHGRVAVDVARRAAVSLAELATLVDELRRRKAGPESSAASLHAAAEALTRYRQEAEIVDRHGRHAAVGGLSDEIERAQRAVELIEHGRELMLDPSGDRVGEGETSVKRGYLNLLHARDAIRDRADAIAAADIAPPGTDPRWRVRNR
jgi:hypothetical protein